MIGSTAFVYNGWKGSFSVFFFWSYTIRECNMYRKWILFSHASKLSSFFFIILNYFFFVRNMRVFSFKLTEAKILFFHFRHLSSTLFPLAFWNQSGKNNFFFRKNLIVPRTIWIDHKLAGTPVESLLDKHRSVVGTQSGPLAEIRLYYMNEQSCLYKKKSYLVLRKLFFNVSKLRPRDPMETHIELISMMFFCVCDIPVWLIVVNPKLLLSLSLSISILKSILLFRKKIFLRFVI